MSDGITPFFSFPFSSSLFYFPLFIYFFTDFLVTFIYDFASIRLYFFVFIVFYIDNLNSIVYYTGLSMLNWFQNDPIINIYF